MNDEMMMDDEGQPWILKILRYVSTFSEENNQGHR